MKDCIFAIYKITNQTYLEEDFPSVDHSTTMIGIVLIKLQFCIPERVRFKNTFPKDGTLQIQPLETANLKIQQQVELMSFTKFLQSAIPGTEPETIANL